MKPLLYAVFALWACALRAMEDPAIATLRAADDERLDVSRGRREHGAQQADGLNALLVDGHGLAPAALGIHCVPIAGEAGAQQARSVGRES